MGATKKLLENLHYEKIEKAKQRKKEREQEFIEEHLGNGKAR